MQFVKAQEKLKENLSGNLKTKNMRYVSIDIETTGLDPERYNILSIGAIIEDTQKKLSFDEIPKFHVAIKHQEVVGSLFAMNMNKELIDAIAQYQDTDSDALKQALCEKTGMQFLNEDDVAESFYQFLFKGGVVNLPPEELGRMQMREVNGFLLPTLTSRMAPAQISVAGKNFASFDKRFLERLPRWKQAVKIRQRIIDPAVLFTDWKNDSELPGLGECKKRAGLEGKVSHNALEDAWDVVQLLRKHY